MDEIVRAIAQGALRRLGAPSATPPAPPPSGATLRLERMTLAQLSNLAYLQAEDPLVQQVMEALKSGRPVQMDRPAVEAHLGLPAYPPRMREQFARWFVRISGYGVHFTGAPEAAAAVEPALRPGPPPLAPQLPGRPATPATSAPALTPEREVLAEILGVACPMDRPCLLEPGKGCCGSGRCRTLGF